MHLLQLLLGSELVGVAALLLSAVGGSGVVSRVALSADHLLAVVLFFAIEILKNKAREKQFGADLGNEIYFDNFPSERGP